jgi:hypothetical protein
LPFVEKRACYFYCETGEAMTGRSEVSISSGRSQITLKGPDAIREAGWALRFLLVAQGAARFFVVGSAVAMAIYAVIKWWLSQGP